MGKSPNSEAQVWAIIPAAGIGSRMDSDIPKQYLQLGGKSVLEHTLEIFVANARIERIVVVLNPEDTYWRKLWSDRNMPAKIEIVSGGAERSQSVVNALEYMIEQPDAGSWALVHDAARPCLRTADLDALLADIETEEIGAILGSPVRDTMKRTDGDATVAATVEREGLWHALTPQLFRAKQLLAAYREGISANSSLTDESSAMELAGYSPRLVIGHADNIKITRIEDLELAELFLRQQGRIGCA